MIMGSGCFSNFCFLCNFNDLFTNLGHAVYRSEVYATLNNESIVVNAIGMSVVAVAILVLYTVRGTGGYRLRKVAAQHPS
ncbi:hypothetical protein HF086_010116 [Spodoptera exigua]|uniref:Uncharacterized protein n=1 Tax=Spodoptera exigua TaxID=7107 RepID=A0A922SPF2_SPOEX|nr:hypothetical protein HF086_010116 [Spodoptera exigua]